ncbi:phage tail tape measure protein [Candidatus Pacearchaeota archaeon]|jgi:TP901 family phage tail tape measure protein|nr:phage tail tape measure protein [Candidatus Pacearchaeota archaeon]
MTENYSIKAILDVSGVKSGITSIKSDMSGLDSSVLKIGEGLSSSLRSGIGDFKSVGTSLGNDLVGGLGAQFGTIGTLAGGVATALGPIGIVAGVAGAGLVALGASSVGVASSFQSSMSKVNSVLGGSQADFDKLSQAARDAGATTTFSASQAADGLYYLASAGYSSDDSISALKATLNVASAGGMDLARASEMLTTDLAVFGLGATDATRVTDLLAAAASASNSDVGQMGDALGLVGGTAKALGISIEDTTTMLALMANGGTKASEAGHKLNSILGELTQASSPQATKAQASAMAELGITADQINPTLHSQSEIFSLLKERGMTSAQSLALFGKENNSVASYVTENADKIDGLNEKILVSGKSAEMAEMMNDNLKGAYAELSSSVEEVQISIGNLLLPALTKIVQGSTKVVSAVTKIGQSFYTIVAGSQAFGAVGQAASAVGTAISTAFSGLAALVTPAWNAIGGGATVFKALQAAFNLVTTPMTVLFKGITSLASAMSAVGSAMSPVSSALGGAFGNAITTASAYIQAFLEAFSNLGPIQSFQSAIQNAADIAGKVWNGLSTTLPQAFSGAFDAVKSLISQFLSWISEKFGGIFDGVGDQIKSSLEESALGGVTSFIGGIQSRANDILNVGKSAGDKVGEGVENSDLADAPGNALKSDKAMAGAEDAGSKLADKTLSAFAKQAAASNLSDEALLGFINSQSNDSRIRSTVYDLYGTAVKYWYDAAESYPTTYLEIGDVKISAAYDKTKGMATIQDLLASLGFSDDIIGSLSSQQSAKMEDAVQKIKDAAVAEAKKKQELKFNFDITETEKQIDDWAPSVQKRIESFFKSAASTIENSDGLGTAFTNNVKSASDDLNKALSGISLEGLSSLDDKWQAAFSAIGATWSGTLGDIATDSIAEYKKNLLSGIADTGAYVDSEMSRIGESAQAALKDGFVSDDDRALFSALGDQISTLRQLFPAEMGDVTDETITEMVRLINAGKIQEAFALVGKESGEEFSDNLLGGANMEVTLQKLASDPETYKQYITNPMKFAVTEGFDGIKQQVADAKDAFTSGIDPQAIYNSYIAPFDKVRGYIPGWASALKQQLAVGRISFEQFFSYFDYYSTQTEKLNSATQKTPTNINAMGSTAKSNSANVLLMGNSAAAATGQLQTMGLAINPLNTISGKGIAVTFSPAKVIADEASATLNKDFATLGDYISKFGTTMLSISDSFALLVARGVNTGSSSVLKLGSGATTLGSQKFSANIEAETDSMDCACGEAFIDAAKASTGPLATISPFYTAEELASAKQTYNQINQNSLATNQQVTSQTYVTGQNVNSENLFTWQQINAQNAATNAYTSQKTVASGNTLASTVYNSSISYAATMAAINAGNIVGANSVSSINTNAANQSASIGINSANQQSSIGMGIWNTGSSTMNTAWNTLSGINTNLASTNTALGTTVSNLGDLNSSILTSVSSMYSSVQSFASALGYSSSNSYWGGTSASGGGYWIGTGSTMVGGYGYTNWGGTAASNYASSNSSGSWGGVSWGAKGADVKAPTLAVIGEAGEELILPPDITMGLKDLIATGSIGRQAIQLPNIEPADIILDGRKIGEVAFKYGTKGIQAKGDFTFR